MKRVLSLLLAVVMVFSIVAFAPAANAANLHTVKIQGKYHQTQARALLKKMNAFRASTNAWAWNYNNTQKVSYPKLQSFTYDYELEQIAMQRAAEIAVYYGADYGADYTQIHKRPNGENWDTAHTNFNAENGYAIGENIFAAINCDTQESAEQAYDAWLEADHYYDGQSHRRNILSVPYPFITTAFACFEVNGVFYWVELFRSQNNINPTPTTVTEAEKYVNVSLNKQFIKSWEMIDSTDAFAMSTGESVTLQPTGKLVTINHLITEYNPTTGVETPYPTSLKVVATLTSSNPNVVRVSGNTITALKTGSVTITASAFDRSFKYTVYVQPSDLATATITLDKHADTYIYTGNPITPQITSVQLGDATLSPEDYSVTYSDNVEIGTGLITIVGKGNYTGVATKTFHIINSSNCNHHPVSDDPVQATCITRGKGRGYHCDICGKVLSAQEDLGYGNHLVIYDSPIEPTCQVEGFTEGSHCALCYAVLTKPVSLGYGEHRVVTDKAVEPTCELDGKTEGSHCTVCNKTIVAQTTIPKFGHDYGAQITKKATLSADGKIYQTCQRKGCGYSKVLKTINYPKTFTLTAETFTYNGKVQKPKFAVKDSAGKGISTANFAYSIPNGKNVGKYKITAKFKGNYSGTKYLYYYIRPKNTSKFTLTAAKKAIKVKWNTQKNQTKGYQIQYSLYADFHTAKTFTLKDNRYNVATISSLTGGKKYYVRMRTYHTVKFEGKAVNIYSFWSGKKSITTKK
ncbi:MAG: hypothetical protein IJI67_05740 [Clostridia bacterium]|nr:hypothetical protein [Clostridia bacterium]